MSKEIFRHTGLLLFFIMLLAAGLRIPYLDHYPPALYSDEVSQGYNAYSILKTGKDEYGKFLPVSLRSFGDWKPPLQTYLMIPTIALFGLNAWGVRLPGAISGTLTVGLMYLLVRDLLNKFDNRPRRIIPLLAALFLAISPWHILQSRSGMLVGVTLFFFYAGLWSFIKGLKRHVYLYISSVSFVAAVYGYYGMRMVVPLTLIFLISFFHKELVKQKKSAFFAMIIAVCLMIPLGIAFVQEPNVLLGRVKTVSIFYDKGVALTVWDLIAQDGVTTPAKLAQFFHNKPYYYVLEVIRRFFEHLDGRFLFTIGDQNPPFQIPNQGVLYLVDAITLVLGLVFLIRQIPRLFQFLVILIIISILPAALTFVTPAQNRTLTMVIPLMLMISFGIFLIQRYLKKWGVVIVTLLYSANFIFFLHNYFGVLPREHANWWHYGYKEMVRYIQTQEDKYNTIVVSGEASVPYIFFLFYNQIDPAVAQRDVKHNFQNDEFGFEYVDRFKKYRFFRYFKWEEDKDQLPEHALFVMTDKEATLDFLHKLQTIVYPNGKTAFTVYEL